VRYNIPSNGRRNALSLLPIRGPGSTSQYVVVPWDVLAPAQAVVPALPLLQQLQALPGHPQQGLQPQRVPVRRVLLQVQHLLQNRTQILLQLVVPQPR